MLKKSDLPTMPPFFDRYIFLAGEGNVIDELEKSLVNIEEEDYGPWLDLGLQTYQEGKWTLLDIMQHLIDNERIMSFRALWFSRNPGSELPGYEENLFAQNARANDKDLEMLIHEYLTVRHTTLDLFRSFDKQHLLSEGIAFQTKISVLALGFVNVGHQMHHYQVVKEKYLTLL